jgi:DNA end-binding protein Ku
MARPTWKGHLRLSLVSCAVTLSPATTESELVRFHMLNPKTQNRVKQQLIDSETGDVVERKDVVKGYEVDKGQFVIVDEKELKNVQIESTHTIDIERFVDRGAVDDLYYSKPYFMVPDGKVAEEAYAVIREAMRRQDKIAIARVVLSAHEHVVIIEPRDEGMSVMTLRAPNEVRSTKSAFAEMKGVKADAEMIKLAESIIATKVGLFEPSLFEDRYQAALRELVEAKMKGRKLPKPQASKPNNVVNLMDALRRSIKTDGAGERTRGHKAASQSAKKATSLAAKRRKAS